MAKRTGTISFLCLTSFEMGGWEEQGTWPPREAGGEREGRAGGEPQGSVAGSGAADRHHPRPCLEASVGASVNKDDSPNLHKQLRTRQPREQALPKAAMATVSSWFLAARRATLPATSPTLSQKQKKPQR